MEKKYVDYDVPTNFSDLNFQAAFFRELNTEHFRFCQFFRSSNHVRGNLTNTRFRIKNRERETTISRSGSTRTSRLF